MCVLCLRVFQPPKLVCDKVTLHTRVSVCTALNKTSKRGDFCSAGCFSHGPLLRRTVFSEDRHFAVETFKAIYSGLAPPGAPVHTESLKPTRTDSL